jgi:regulator of G-protein signaling
MEKLVREMQHPETGVPVRMQKIFLTTIPCAFTGYDLIEWLVEKLHLEESAEALHLGGLLCQYGYYFPVTDSKILAVKDDSTLYRFQSPYFWPSQNWEPDNVDYAIYLAKRSMRNKQKHGLDEYEQAAFNKLQKMLCDKWDFIFMQAEEQVRLAKERKKADKVVLDSQERAFWRVHRPPPGHVRCLEEGVRRNYQPSQMAKRKKKNIEGYKKEIEFLKASLSHARMKTSKAADSLTQRSELYHEHDPFSSPAQPSNPWVTDDTTMWSYYNNPEAPNTERQVKRWAFSMQETLSDPKGLEELESFTKKEFSSENLHFWLSIERLKLCPLSHVSEIVEEIYK